MKIPAKLSRSERKILGVLDLLKPGRSLNVRQISCLLAEWHRPAIGGRSAMLGRLVKRGMVERIARGVYRLRLAEADSK